LFLPTLPWPTKRSYNIYDTYLPVSLLTSTDIQYYWYTERSSIQQGQSVLTINFEVSDLEKVEWRMDEWMNG
jgi:hypothetical protein